MTEALLLVDPTLRGYGGHPYRYDMAVADAAASSFCRVEIAAGDTFSNEARHTIRPIFRDADAFAVVRGLRFLLSMRDRGTVTKDFEDAEADKCALSKGIGSFIPHRTFNHFRGKFFYCDCLQYLRGAVDRSEKTHIFFTTAHPYMLARLRNLAESVWRIQPEAYFHLLFRVDPTFFCSRIERREDLRYRLVSLHKYGSGKIRYYVDTEELAREYESLTFGRATFPVLPIPSETCQSGAGEGRRNDRELRLGFLGMPRLEKGIALLPYLIRAVPSTIEGRKIHFVVQGPGQNDSRMLRDLFSEMKAAASAPNRPILSLHPFPMEPARYADLISGVDAVALPYDRCRYRASSSGVMVEALCSGLPILPFTGTWMARIVDQALAAGFQIGEPLPDARALAPALSVVARNLDKYKQDAHSFYQRWRENNTMARLIAALRRDDCVD